MSARRSLEQGIHGLGVAAAGEQSYPCCMKTLEEMIHDLPPEAQRQVIDFTRELAGTTKISPKRKLTQQWAGALKRYRDQYTSLDLQQRALGWRSD